MGNLISQSQKLYTFKWNSLYQDDIFVPVQDSMTLPHPLHGKILIPFTQVHEKEEFIKNNHHKVILINDSPQLSPFLQYKFRGLPIISEEQLMKQPKNCLKMHFNCKYCPVPLILERFSQNLLSNYLNTFHVYGINAQFYERLQMFLKAECRLPLIVCTNYQLQQLSHRIQSLTYRNEKKEKLTILCFCNKDQYTFPKKTQIVMQKSNIEVFLFQNMLQIIQKINKDSLLSPSGISQKSEKLLFYVDEKEKQVNYLSKMAKRIEKTLRYLKVQKIFNKGQLIQQIKENQSSIVVIGKDSKQMRNFIDISQTLQEEGLQDRVIFLRRDAQFNDRLIQKIQNVTAKPNYVHQTILQKHIVFYGTLDNFKSVLKYFPKLNFKKFIDSSSDKQSIKSFLKISTQVVMTHLRLCDCMEKWKDQIKCKVILVRSRLTNHQKNCEKSETKGCLKQHWYYKEDQLLYASQSSGQQLYGLNFNYMAKKMTYISGIICEVFTKFKQKKTILHNQLFGTVFLFSCQYYFFDQISSHIIKYFLSKDLGNFDKPCQFQHLKFRLYQELLHLNKSIGIEQEAIYHLEKDESQNVFQLADRLIEWVTKYPILLDQINNIWELFIYRDRPEYLFNCNTLLFLLLLAYNKTNFVTYHNQTLQNVTLRIKHGLVSCDREAQNVFQKKVKSSYVYNFSFLLCQQVKPDAIQQPGEIFIRIDGSQLNNFGLFLPIWRNDSTFLIAPLTKLQISTKAQFLKLKISLNTQQKMLQKFTQYFLSEKPSLKLFKEQRQMRKLDCFLENMSCGKLETAGYILNKMVKQSPVKNGDLVNAYVIFHHLKRAQIDEAYQKLRNDKYHQILSTLIASCREGSSVQAAHSSLNDQKQESDSKSQKNRQLCKQSQISSGKQSALYISKAINSQFNLMPPKNKRSPSEIIIVNSNSSIKARSRRYPVAVKHVKGNDQQISCQNNNVQNRKLQSEVKIKILPPAHDQLYSSQHSKQIEDYFVNTNPFKNFEKKELKQLYHCSLNHLNSSSSHNEISQFIKFDDSIIQSNESLSPLRKKQSTKKDFSLKPSNFYLIQNIETEHKKSQQNQFGTASSTGKFNFQQRKSQLSPQYQEELIQNNSEAQNIDLMEPVLQQEVEKNSDSSSQTREKETETDFFKFSLGAGNPGKGLFNIKKKNQHLPRDSIKYTSSKPGTILHPHLINIEQESLQLASNQNILLSSASLNQSQSNKENLELKRSNDKKLFTFSKNEGLISNELKKAVKQPHLLVLREESLVFSTDSMIKSKQANTPSSKKQLFSMFDEQQDKISQNSSISSIDIQEVAQPITPQELIESRISNL